MVSYSPLGILLLARTRRALSLDSASTRKRKRRLQVVSKRCLRTYSRFAVVSISPQSIGTSATLNVLARRVTESLPPALILNEKKCAGVWFPKKRGTLDSCYHVAMAGIARDILFSLSL